MSAFNQQALDQFGFCFDNSYSRLPNVLFTRANPKKFKNPSLVIFNEPLAISLGLNVDALTAANWSCFSGQATPINAFPN